jgi:uncharacterized membrane protein
VSPEEKHEMSGHLVRVAASFSYGPLPPPEALERYNQILPGAADRILAMAERQEQHRQEMEGRVIASNVSSQKLGLKLGFVIAMAAIVGGIWLALAGKSGAGLTSIIAALAALVGVFVYGKKHQSRELDEKAKALPSSAAASQQH